MDTSQWPQVVKVGVVEEEISRSSSSPLTSAKPEKGKALNCPRCNSTNTKFCYYNNYSLTQPRFFCKTCRRYWTEGGSLRNVPVGGCSRKNKRSSSSSSPISSSSSKFIKVQTLNLNHDFHRTPLENFSQNPKIHEGQDLNLAFTSPPPPPPPLPLPLTSIDDHAQDKEYTHLLHHDQISIPIPIPIQNPNSYFSSRGLNLVVDSSNNNGSNDNSMIQIPPIMSNSSTMFASSNGFPFDQQVMKPTLNFSMDHHGFGSQTQDQSGYSVLQSRVMQEENGDNNGGHARVLFDNNGGHARVLFPLEDTKPVATNGEFVQNRGQLQGDDLSSAGGGGGGYWSRMLGGGGSW